MVINKRVLVVGTTGDYVESLMKSSTCEAVFLTDPEERLRWASFGKSPEVEVLCVLNNQDLVIKTLKSHFKKYDISLSGVVCFDCESLALAAVIAEEFQLPFPSLKSVIDCRSKYLSKHIWQSKNVLCPEVFLVKSLPQVVESFYKLNSPVVLKPLTGSGSELVFLCKDEKSCREAYQCLCDKLVKHVNQRMYTSDNMPEDEDPHKIFVMEQYIGGEEYSCDFVLEGGEVKVIRLVHKVLSSKDAFGTVLSYVLPGDLPKPWTIKRLENILLKASIALGLNRVIAMVDFKIENEKVYLIEMTPRPGGDCLPPLIYASSGFNMLEAALDFAKGKKICIPRLGDWKTMVGMHLISNKKGIIKNIDITDLVADKRVVSWHLKRKSGDVISLPPDDYDSRMLGYVIFKPVLNQNDEVQCREIRNKLIVQWEKNVEGKRADARKNYQHA